MTARFGAFGKMPSLGDFFRIDLAQGFVDPWDRWLQEGIVGAKAALGARWQDSYFSAPIWRFSLSPGLAGAAAVTGVMMMSVDRVGRQFPLTFAAVLPDGTDPMLDHLIAGDTFTALEGVALDALEDTMTREGLAARLGQIERPERAVDASGLRGEHGGAVIVGDGDVLHRLAAETLRSSARRGSVWSAEMEGETRLMVCAGLPAGGQLVGLFDMAARLWTGHDPRDTLPLPAEPIPDIAPADIAPDTMATLPPKALAAPPTEHVPLEDPLADILLPDDPVMDLADHGDDDPLAEILSGDDPAILSGDDPAPIPGAVQEA